MAKPNGGTGKSARPGESAPATASPTFASLFSTLKLEPAQPAAAPSEGAALDAQPVVSQQPAAPSAPPSEKKTLKWAPPPQAKPQAKAKPAPAPWQAPLWLRKATTYAVTTWRTFLESAAKPALAGFALALLAFVAFALAFALPQVNAAIDARTLEPLANGQALRALGAATAVGAAGVAVWSWKDYLFAGRRHLLAQLTHNIPNNSAALSGAGAHYVRFYHGVLRWCGAFAFLCELGLQLAAFALVTWGAAAALPALELFDNPEQLTLANVFGFWTQHLFWFVDGPRIFGVTLTPLAANTGAWGFGLVQVAFKIGFVAFLVKLVQTSISLHPSDISPAWAAAYDRAA